VAVEPDGFPEGADSLDQRPNGGRRRDPDRVGEHQLVRLQLAGELDDHAGVDLALEGTAEGDADRRRRRAVGLGGCPYAPRATGNIATEDLVYLLEGEGIETGVDLDALVRVSEWLEALLGRQLEGQVYRAGVSAVASP